MYQPTRNRKFECECDGPREPVDPAHSKTEGWVDKAGSVRSEGTGDWDVCSHLTERYHNGEDDRADEDVCNQGASWAGRC